jgi:hypothetical protein
VAAGAEAVSCQGVGVRGLPLLLWLRSCAQDLAAAAGRPAFPAHPVSMAVETAEEVAMAVAGSGVSHISCGVACGTGNTPVRSTLGASVQHTMHSHITIAQLPSSKALRTTALLP